jgi:hypothetical protein
MKIQHEFVVSIKFQRGDGKDILSMYRYTVESGKNRIGGMA